MAMKEPAETAASLERSPAMPSGDAERFVGYGVMAAPFASGDLLAMRRFPASSLGHGYTSVWHRTPAGEWTIYADRPPLESCARYFGCALTRAVQTPIALSWRSARRMEIAMPFAQLTWSVDLAQTRTTRFINALGRTMSDRMWRSPQVIAAMSRVASTLLRAERLGLSGRAPNGQAFIANPMTVWLIADSCASIAGRELGALAPLPEQTKLGDFWIPQRPLFAFGRAFFETFDETRHVLVPQARRANVDGSHAPPP